MVPQGLFYVSDGLTCLTFLVGVGAGVFLITRQQKVTGSLAVAGFLLLGLNVLVNLIIWRVLVGVANDFTVSSWTSFCSGIVFTVLGGGSLAAAIIVYAQSQAPEEEES
jgi:hypothetical protein